MKIKIHESLILLIILALFCGFIQNILIIYCLVLFHELAHIIACIYYQRKIYKITAIPFGGIIEFSSLDNKPLKEDLVICSAGVFLNLILFIFFRLFLPHTLWEKYNEIILFFNLLPIFPLDGGRILEGILLTFFPYKKGTKILLSWSIVVLISAFIYSIIRFQSLGLIFVLVYLLYSNFKALYNKKYREQAFLTKKYLYPNLELKTRYFSKFKDGLVSYFKKGVNNSFGTKEKNKSESEILMRYFEKK